jgi:alpha-galactosidase
MGFELHPKDLLPEELEFAKSAVADYKRIRPVVQQGDLYRLVSPYEKPMAALMYAGRWSSSTAAVIFAYGLDGSGEVAGTLRLRGLDPDAKYAVNEINCRERRHLEPLYATGRELMERGLAVLLSGPYDSAVFEVTNVFQQQRKGMNHE